MARWRTKGDPVRVTNWLGTLRYHEGDALRLVKVAGVGTVGVQVITVWRGSQLTDGAAGVDVFAQSILDLAQGHSDELRERAEYRVELLRKEESTPECEFTLRCEPQDGENSFDDEDPTPGGQIRQQMAFTRQILHYSQRAPIAAMEMMARQLDLAQQRIHTLENERAAMLDTYAEALTMIAEVQAAREPGPSVVEQITEVTKVAPGIISIVRSLLPAGSTNTAPSGIVKV